MDDLVLRASLVLIGCVAVLAGALWFIKKRGIKFGGVKNSESPVEILHRQPLGAKTNLFVVKVRGKQLVLGVTESNVSILSEIVDVMPPNTSTAPETIKKRNRDETQKAIATQFDQSIPLQVSAPSVTSNSPFKTDSSLSFSTFIRSLLVKTR